ncbi:isochorismatase family protein [Streptomyces sp. NPDC002928]|uniref:isochorismatase family protein n=1 Tax=Streptomyces sp. NPDC002928 TaxID=3154440 RepID=UPI0033A465BB
MPISPIAAYPLPRRADWPADAVRWRPDPSRAALLVHDMQEYFLAPYAAQAEPRRSVTANAAALLDAARRTGMPVYYTAQPGSMTSAERGLLMDVWGPGMRADEADRSIVAPLAPAPGETVLTKWRYSAFARTDLADRLAAAGRDQLIVCGVYAHVGCLMTACDAFTRDIQPFLVADALADFSRDYHVQALTYAAERCAATPATAEVLDALLPVPVPALASATH